MNDREINVKMATTKVVLMACGSFNPPTNMHLRMFEIARDHLHRMGRHVVVGGIISPTHDAYGKKELEMSTHRLAMTKLALQNHDWVKLSEWECKQECWTRTRQVLQYHENQINGFLKGSRNNHYDLNENDNSWLPDITKNGMEGPVKVKLLCGGDLLESFSTPGVWADEDIEAIVGHHGLIVVTRSKSNPLEFIYNSDMLTKYISNIMIVTEWIKNEISSSKIRRALRRSESVRYLLQDKVIDYIHKHHLYGSEKSKYLMPLNTSTVFLTPSPQATDIMMGSPSPTSCLYICNNNLFSRNVADKKMSIDDVDHFSNKNFVNSTKHPGQAVKIITENTGIHKVINEEINNKEVCKEDDPILKCSKSYANFQEIESKGSLKHANANYTLKECKSCDENLIKFIFTKHGIQVISDVETIV